MKVGKKNFKDKLSFFSFSINQEKRYWHLFHLTGTMGWSHSINKGRERRDQLSIRGELTESEENKKERGEENLQIEDKD